MHGYDYQGQQPAAEGVKELKITYPVVDDVKKQVWKDYGVVYRPSWALIAKDGSLIDRQVGEAITPAVKQKIEAALK